ncbi:MAG: hypothetical protein IJC10_04565 [Clostridia bacterium]|nr:hypothetical protein [Clostridia bacterium]
MKSKYRCIFYFLSFAILFLLTLKISPLADDWYYLTSPNLNPELTQLLPNELFWRPFDALFGFLLGQIPMLFPYLNRAFVITAHILSVYYMEKCLRHFEIKDWVVNFCVLYAMFSSAIYATIVSPDGLNQACGLLFGLIGMYQYIKYPNKLNYVFFCAISTLWKESGMVWICVIPFLSIMISSKRISSIFTDKKIRIKTLNAVIIACAFVIVYFSLRFALLGSITLGNPNSRYSLSLFSLGALKNFVNIFANAMTGIDTISLFVKTSSPIPFIITLLLSVMFLCYMMYLLVRIIQKRENIIKIFALIVGAIIISLPHIAMGSAGEMHTYPTIFFICLIYSFLLNNAPTSSLKSLVPFAICIFIAFSISASHKLTAIYDYSNRTDSLSSKMKENYTNSEDSLLIISLNENNGYSVFTQSAIAGTSYGESMKQYFDWQDLPISYAKVDHMNEVGICINQNLKKFDKIWLIQNDEIKLVK